MTLGMSAPPTARSVIASTTEDPPNTIQPSLLQDLQFELTPEQVERNFGRHGVESESTESAHDVQEVLDAVPPVVAKAERAVAGTTDDSDHQIGDIVVIRAFRAAFICLDGVDLVVMFKTRAHVMKSPPKFLRGAYKSAMRVALREWEAGTEVGDDVRRCRAWKLFVLLPRMLLRKPVRGGLVPKSKMSERFASFSQGRWDDLLIQSRDSALAAVQPQVKRRRRPAPNCPDVRAERAHRLTQLGELSAARHALEGDPPAPGNNATLQLLRDPERRPTAPRGPLAPELAGHQPDSLVDLEKDRLLKNLRSARRRAVGRPSGMTADHMRPVLDSERDGESFWRVCEEFGRAGTPDEVVQALRMGRMRALQKSSGGVRGIVVGDFLRRLVATTIGPRRRTCNFAVPVRSHQVGM